MTKFIAGDKVYKLGYGPIMEVVDYVNRGEAAANADWQSYVHCIWYDVNTFEKHSEVIPEHMLEFEKKCFNEFDKSEKKFKSLDSTRQNN